MKVKLLTPRITADEISNTYGDIIDVPDREGRKMIENGHALPVADEIETTMVAIARGGQPHRATRTRN